MATTQALFDQLDADGSGAIDLDDVLVHQDSREDGRTRGPDALTPLTSMARDD